MGERIERRVDLKNVNDSLNEWKCTVVRFICRALTRVTSLTRVTTN